MPLRLRIGAFLVFAAVALPAAVAALAQVHEPGERLAWGLAAVLVLFVALGGVVFTYERHAMRPVERAGRLLEALAQADMHAAPQAGDLCRPGEIGRMHRSIAMLRQELVTLHGRLDQRRIQRQSRDDALREQLRRMACSLDDAARAEILCALEAEDLGAEDEFAGLVRLLGCIASQLTTQQERLVGVLNELRQALEHQATLAGLRQELQIARDMQQSILPRPLPAMRGVDITALMVPAREVGGDFYDYFMIDEHHFALVIADVSGKGIPAAFFMAITRTLLKSNALFLREASQVITRLNEQLCAGNEQAMFVTAVFAVLDMRSGMLDFVNAGHTAPMLRDRQGGVRVLPRAENPALGVLEGHQFLQRRVRMQAGDTLLLYTDGMTEAADPAGRLFGEERLMDAVRVHDPACEDLTQALLRRVRAFEAGCAQADDVACVAVRYEPCQLAAGVPAAALSTA